MYGQKLPNWYLEHLQELSSGKVLQRVRVKDIIPCYFKANHLISLPCILLWRYSGRQVLKWFFHFLIKKNAATSHLSYFCVLMSLHWAMKMGIKTPLTTKWTEWKHQPQMEQRKHCKSFPLRIWFIKHREDKAQINESLNIVIFLSKRNLVFILAKVSANVRIYQ